MARILGLDLGTNSLGWAVIDEENGQFALADKGVRIFQEGVKIEKGIENSKAADRTEHRSARRLKYRRKLRKIETLKVLSEFGYCPALTEETLNLWRYKRIYPNNLAFKNWWLTNDENNIKEKNPYFFRHLCITKKLDLNNEADKQKIGRAFYHIAQRRGFLSNRLDSTPENEKGKVKSNIRELQERKGGRTLGQYFYEDCYLKGEKIRNQYTHREEDYLDEFNRICEFQNIPKAIRTKLNKAIFYQRPLKSQKGLIGKCVFEPNKARCSTSRPEFEEYRMLCFINNIKIKTPDDEKLRVLNTEERNKIIPRFFLQKEHFDFDDLAKQLAPKKQYKFYKDRNKNTEDYLFNYSMKTTVSGCPVSARFKELFGNSFIDDSYQFIKNKNGNTPKIITDAWHALYTFDSDKKLKQFAKETLKLDDEQCIYFTDKIHLKQDFASLSLKAINKILPYLREGLIYSHAVFLANMEETVPAHIWEDDKNKILIKKSIKDIILNQRDQTLISNTINGFITDARKNNNVWSNEAKPLLINDLESKIISVFGINQFQHFSEEKKKTILDTANTLLEIQMQKDFGKGEYVKIKRLDESVISFLEDNFGHINEKKLYHPSAIETYKPAQRRDDGRLYLGSPMTSSVRNPMAMRALHQLRLVINALIKEGIIDNFTKIHIEMSRGLLNANERAGLRTWQNGREKKRKEYEIKIKEFLKDDKQPSEDEILKYQLWEEQNHKCLYSGHEIAINEFLGANPSYDIEHTIPRSLSYDNSQENKTLCENRFNRDVKRNAIPSELTNHKEILARIEHWEEKIEDLDKQIERTVKQAKGATDKAQKDSAIQRRHQLSYERNYWKNKYKRFTMEDVPEGFKNSQMVDIGIITKYSRLYLKTVFDKVYTVKGNTVADFRKIWGLQNEYEKKARINHIHHCVDAITMACMTKDNYEKLAKYYHDRENAFLNNKTEKPQVKKPWKTFTQDVLDIENEVLISHYTPDNLPKQSKKKIRVRGKIQYKADYKKDLNGKFLKDKRGKKIIEHYHTQTILDENGNKKLVKISLYEQGDTVRGSLHKDTFYGAIEREVINKKGETEKQIKYVVRKPLVSLEDSNIKNIVDEKVKEIIINARKEEKVIQKQIDSLTKKRKNAEECEEPEIDKDIEELKKAIQLLYSLPNKNGKPIPIKKVRVLQPTVTNPLHIKKQRDISQQSRKEYKEHYHVANDGNYLMAIYEGKDAKGKILRDFELVNNIDAGEYFKLSVKKDLEGQELDKYEGLLLKTKTVKKTEIPFKAVIKPGTMVILWESSPEEVWDLRIEEIMKRYYKVVGLSINRIKRSSGKIDEYATIVLRFNQEATSASDLKTQDGVFKSDEKYMAQRKMNHNQFNALIENIDFKLSPLGKITKI